MFFPAFLIALFASGLSAWPIYRMLVSAKSRQTISQFAPEGHQAKQGTPTMGGLIILVGMLAGLGWLSLSFFGKSGWTNSALFLTVTFGLIGFVDDFVMPRMVKGSRGLGWKQKLAMQFVCAVASLLPAFGSNNLIGIGIGVFVILFFSNAYNFSDGLDALAGLILLAFCVGVMGISQTMMIPSIYQMSQILACSVIPFLFLNAPPARVFMGDVGSLPIGAVLGLFVLGIGDVGVRRVESTAFGFGGASHTNHDSIAFQLFPHPGNVAPGTFWTLAILSVVMIAELVPVPLQILSVKLRKQKLFPYTPIHHAFEKAGWPETRVTFMFALVQLVASVVAIVIADLAVGRYR